MIHADLPYDSTCPVFYDNDDHRDVYTDEFLLALQSAGRIDLRGISTTYSHDEKEYEEFLEGRKHIVDHARRSGMKGLPDPLPGPDEQLIQPQSGNIEDTEPIESTASQELIQHAETASPERPLVVITGGPLSVVADAYLQEPTITDTVVVASLLGTTQDTAGWNGELDSWATYIVTSEFEYVQFPTYRWPPTVRKADLRNRLPDSPLKEWMITKQHPSNELPDGADFDGQPVVPLVTTEYVKSTVRCTVGEYQDGVCLFREIPEGNITLVLAADGHQSGQQAFFEALTDPNAFE